MWPLPSQHRLAGGAGYGSQPGPLDWAHRPGRAGGDHQDPATTLLLHRRTAHSLGAPPYPASAPALALGSPVQSRSGSIARLASPSLMMMMMMMAAATGTLTSPPPTSSTPTSTKLAPDRPPSVSCCVLSLGERLDTTTADRPMRPTVQNLPGQSLSRTLISLSATVPTPFVGFGFTRIKHLDFWREAGCLRGIFCAEYQGRQVSLISPNSSPSQDQPSIAHSTGAFPLSPNPPKR